MTAVPIHRIIEGMEQGRISSHEAESYLTQVYGMSLQEAQQPPQKHPFVEELGKHWHSYVVLLAMFIAIGLGAIFVPQVGITGLVTYNSGFEGQNLTGELIPIHDEITGLSVSGVLYGDGTAQLLYWSDNSSYLVASLSSDAGVPRTAKASYIPGENVTLEYVVGEATYYLDDGVGLNPIDALFGAPSEGEYEILVIQNSTDGLSTDRVPLVVSEVPVARKTVFTDTCEETCVLSPDNGTLQIVTDGTTVELSSIDVETPQANRAPEVLLPLDNITINETTVVDLSQHFVDADEDELLYSTSQSDLVSVDVTGATLTLTPSSPGTETFRVYVSDLEEILETSFGLTVIIVEVNETPTVNDTLPVVNGTNVTINATVPAPIPSPVTNTTNLTLNTTALVCDHPLVNERPIECLQMNSSEYFPQQNIYWESPDREIVGQFNQIGNLLITGDVVELSSGGPDRDDFRIGNIDRDGQQEALIWTDSETGNLHLKGILIEEVVDMAPAPGSYSIITKRGIYLAYVNMRTGDMYLRGNIIPYRRSLG